MVESVDEAEPVETKKLLRDSAVNRQSATLYGRVDDVINQCLSKKFHAHKLTPFVPGSRQQPRCQARRQTLCTALKNNPGTSSLPISLWGHEIRNNTSKL